jgi:hypothetical protein
VGLLDTRASESRKANDFLLAKECDEDDVKATEAIVKMLEKQENYKNQFVAGLEDLEKDGHMGLLEEIHERQHLMNALKFNR